jgi:hypothetical protein
MSLTVFRIMQQSNPQGQRDNLNKSVQSLQNFLRMVTPELNTDEAKRAVTYALSSANLDERQVDESCQR